jgi:hypothetical protein
MHGALSPRTIAEDNERTRVNDVIFQYRVDAQRQQRDAERLEILAPGRDGRLSAEAELLLSRERAEKDEKDRQQRMIVAASRDRQNDPYRSNGYYPTDQYSSETMRREIDHSNQYSPTTMHTKIDHRMQETGLPVSHDYFTNKYSSDTMRREINRRVGYPPNYQIDDGQIDYDGAEIISQVQDSLRSRGEGLS